MLRRILSTLGSVAPYLFSFLIGLLLVLVLANSLLFAPKDKDAVDLVSFEIKPGSNLKEVSKDLEAQNIVRRWFSIYLLARIKERENSDGSAQVILPGEYRFSRSWSPAKILNSILNQEVFYQEVRIVEGMRLEDIAEQMAKTTLTTLRDAMNAVHSRALSERLQVSSSSLEGYLFPATYKFTKPDTAEDMIAKMVQEGRKRFTREMLERAFEMDLTLQQVLTIASIIEKETGDPSERELISGVIHNRLRIGMPLQVDPTVIYGIENFDGKLTRQHLNTPSPYNTYLNTGLPPTPICSPGEASIRAALHPADTDFLYFVAKGDGTHHFSTTYKEHREAVDRFQLGKGTTDGVDNEQ